MKLISVTALFFSVVWLVGEQAAAIAQLSPSAKISAPTAQLSRDVAPFPNFFQQGQESLDREIQLLYQRQNAPSASSGESLSEPPLKINVNPQAERDRLPQIQPSESQSQ